MKNWVVIDGASRLAVLGGLACMGYAEATQNEKFAALGVMLAIVGILLSSRARKRQSEALRDHEDFCDKSALDVARAAGYNSTHEATQAISARGGGQPSPGHELGESQGDLFSVTYGGRKDTYYVVVPTEDNRGVVAKPVDRMVSTQDRANRPDMSHFQRIVSAVQRLEQQYKIH